MIIVNPQAMQIQMQNNAYQQLLAKQKEEAAKAAQGIQYKVPEGWSTEETKLQFQQQVCCCGKDQLFTQTNTLGKIVFFKGGQKCCGILPCHPAIFTCLKCKCTGHSQIKYKFNNIPDENCPVEIELCCAKTALIRYNGTVIGRVEQLISYVCSTQNRFLVQPIDESRVPFTLIPLFTCQNCMDDCTGHMCRYPKTIDVQRSGKSICQIKNNDIKNNGCVFAWSLIYPPYAQGQITFAPDLKPDEKILLAVGWIIQHAYISGVL